MRIGVFRLSGSAKQRGPTEAAEAASVESRLRTIEAGGNEA